MGPEVTVIMPAYNEEKYLRESIESVLKQTFSNWELIIVNDASIDNTENIAKKFAKQDSRIKLISHSKNKLRSGSLNTGLKHAKGKYICFLDGDDTYLPNKLKKQVKFFKNKPWVDMVYSDMIEVNSEGKKISKVNAIEFKTSPLRLLKHSQKRKDLNEISPYRYLFYEDEKHFVPGDLNKKKFIPGCSVMIRKSVFDSGLRFDETLSTAQDYDMWFQIIGAGFKIEHFSFFSYCYRIHENQVTTNLKKKNQGKMKIMNKLRRGAYFKNKKLKVLFECPSYLPKIGGIQRSTHEIAKRLVKKGQVVTIVCESFSKAEKMEDLIDGVRVLRFPQIATPSIIKPFSDLQRIFTINKFLKSLREKERFDIVISRYPFFNSVTKSIFPRTPLIYFQPSIPTIAILNSAKFSQGLWKKTRRYIRSKIMYFIEKRGLCCVDEIVSRGKAMSFMDKHFFNCDKQIGATIGTGIDFNKFHPAKKDAKFLKNFKLKNGNVLLTVSRLSPDKNVGALLDVFSMVKTKDVKLVIVGDGTELETLQKKAEKLNISDRTLFVGKRNDPEKFYRLADIFILTSKQEGFGNVFIEAMASGLPVLGFKAQPPKIVTAIEDIINKNRCGFAVKNEKEMSSKIDRLLNDESLRKKICKNALKESKKYSWENCAEKLIEIINKHT
jgi:glycosyltransferase involved in cell wall biosynthesis/GT2 family glycosyltransferase